MKLNQNSQEFCQDHSGVCEKMKALERSDEQQWQAINGMRNRSMANLVATIFTLIGIIVTLATMLFKS